MATLPPLPSIRSGPVKSGVQPLQEAGLGDADAAAVNNARCGFSSFGSPSGSIAQSNPVAIAPTFSQRCGFVNLRMHVKSIQKEDFFWK